MTAAGHSPPTERSPLWGRIGGIVVVAVVFWIDVVTPMGVAVPVLYVAAVLLFMLGGRYWEPLLVAGASTALIVVGTFLKPAGELPNPGLLNRGIETLVVWISAGIVSRYRWTLVGWAAQHEADRAADQHAEEGEQGAQADGVAPVGADRGGEVGALHRGALGGGAFHC